MTDKPSVALQHASVLHVLTSYEKSARPDSSITENCRAAIESLKWIERNAAVIREVHRLIREAPVVAEVLRTWPGAKIEELR
jgi:hypothetical protein